MSEEILGNFEIVDGLLLFTSKRVIVARAYGGLKTFLLTGVWGTAIKKHRAVKKYKKLSEGPLEDILALDRKNFAIPYAKITKVKMNRPGFLRGNIIITTIEKEYKFWIKTKKEFKNQLNLVSSILPDKISV